MPSCCPSHLPRFPIYIPSKSRADLAWTPHVLDRLGVPWHLIVEPHQLAAYAQHYPRDRLLILDPEWQDTYDTCDTDGDTLSKGPGPARNYAWQHSIDQGYPWHWVMDDNIRAFLRLHNNERVPVGDGSCFHAMESFALRYENLGMAGPNYVMFAPARNRAQPFTLNTRVFSCNLIRNDLPMRWRGRYNEDLILSIDLLKAGWCTVQFNAFLQKKLVTQAMPGGNTEAFYQLEGTLRKSVLAQMVHPDVVEVVRKYRGTYRDELGREQQGRWHHTADFSQFQGMGLVRLEPLPDDCTHDYSWRVQPNPHYRQPIRSSSPPVTP